MVETTKTNWKQLKTLEHRTHTTALKVGRYDDIKIAFRDFYPRNLNSLVNFLSELIKRTILTFNATLITYVAGLKIEAKITKQLGRG